MCACVCVRYGNATQRVIASGTNIDLKRQKVRMAADIAANIKRFSMLFIPDVSKSSCLRAHNIAKPHTPLKTTCCCWWCGSSCCLPSWPLLQCSVVDAGKNFNLKQGKWSPMAAHASLSLFLSLLNMFHEFNWKSEIAPKARQIRVQILMALDAYKYY